MSQFLVSYRNDCNRPEEDKIAIARNEAIMVVANQELDPYIHAAMSATGQERTIEKQEARFRGRLTLEIRIQKGEYRFFTRNHGAQDGLSRTAGDELHEGCQASG